MTHHILSSLSWKLDIFCKWSANGSDTFRFFKFLQKFYLIFSENPTNILYNFCKKK